MPPENRILLEELERLLQPVTLEQKVRSFVFSKTWGHLDVADGDGEEENDELTNANSLDAHQRVVSGVEELAKEVSDDESLLQELLPDLLSDGSGRQYAFGKGLALASPDVIARWSRLCLFFSQIEPSKRDTRLLAGFVEGAALVDAAATEGFLDGAVRDPVLAEYFPLLQGEQCNDAAGKRLLDSLEHSVAPISRYYWVSRGLRGGGMSALIHRAILLKLAQLPGGYQVAIDALGMELHVHRSEKSLPAAELISLGRELLNMFNFEVNDDNFAYHLNEVAIVCMRGQDATAVAVGLCQRFAEALKNYRSGVDSFRKLAETLFKHQTAAALDAFLGQPPTALGHPLLTRFSLSKKSVVNSAPIDELLAWVSLEPAVRAPLLAAEIEIHCIGADGVLSWSPIAASLLGLAPNKQDVLDKFAECFHPRAWSGSISGVLRPFQELVMQLAKNEDATVAAWAKGQLALMADRIVHESRIDQRIDERFE